MDKRKSERCLTLAERVAKNYNIMMIGSNINVQGYLETADLLLLGNNNGRYYELPDEDNMMRYQIGLEKLHALRNMFPTSRIKGVYIPVGGKPRRLR